MVAFPRPLVFALNGSRVELASPDPALTLLSFLRSHTRFTGTKLSCGEGGCGACLVLLSKYSVKTKEIEEFSINSCLTPLCSIDGCSITTIEGLGSTQNGFHAIQERVAGFHGSQCGFCTPGMCMAIYSCLRNSHSQKPVVGSCDGDGHDVVHPPPLGTLPTLSLEDAQKAIVGNICRCTGYRPIIDACKSFSGEVDIEDLGINTFWPSTKEADGGLLPLYRKQRDPVFPEFLINELKSRELQPVNMGHEGVANANISGMQAVDALTIRYVDGMERHWVRANTLEDVFQALQLYEGQDHVQLVVGNTSSGYYKDRKPRVFIDISHVPQLLSLQETSGSLEVGAAVTIQKLIHALEAKSIGVHDEDSVAQGLVLHLQKLANSHVRNRASIGGNLIMAQEFSFDSDVATLFLAIGATLKVVGADGNWSLWSTEDFLQKGALDYGTILESISIPLWIDCKVNRSFNERSVDSQITRHFKSYRAAPRQLGNALAFINAAFLIDISDQQSGIDKSVTSFCIEDVRLAFGAFGQGHAIRTHKVESFLLGKTVSPGTLFKAIELLKDELGAPLSGTKKASYRSSVAVGFLFDFFRPFLPDMPLYPAPDGAISDCHQHQERSDSRDGCDMAGSEVLLCDFGPSIGLKRKNLEEKFHISGKQSIPNYEDDHSLGKPAQKYEAKLQAAGEAVYVDDIPSPQGCLFAAFVLSSKAFAKVKCVDSSLALASPGAVAFISALDIPKGGANSGPMPFGGSENLFATDLVEYAGHPLGIMVADSPAHAQDAASKVIVEYSMDGLGLPVLSIEEAVAQNSFFKLPPSSATQVVGDIGKGFSDAHQIIVDAEVRTGSQYYFYMETQTALAIPDEDNCMVIYNSCQNPEFLQQCISTCLGIPHHNVRVITRRVGGGFGGKAYRNVTLAAACAVAAHKLRHPVRMYLDRKTDMIMMGGRHPMKTVYSVAFTSDGKVTGLRANIFLNGGWSEDFTPILPLTITDGLVKYNWGTMHFDIKACKTNLSSKSAMRAPGHLQGSFFADTVLEHVASVLGLDVHSVMTKNIHTLDSLQRFHGSSLTGGAIGYTLPSMWGMMLQHMEARQRDINSFNSSNIWRKRGLSVIPCVYGVYQKPQPAKVSIFLDGSVAVEVGGIELGQGLWTKVEQATKYGLRQLLTINGSPELLRVRVVQADSISLPHGGETSGSTTSEGSCEAVRQACQLLVDRIMPVKAKKEQQSIGGFSWTDLINEAQKAGVNLSAHVHWFPEQSTMRYLNYGVAASEVEINIFTGAIVVLQSDLIYDCGKSLNPAVDIGQIEGSFVQGIGFFLTEEHEVDSKGILVSNSTWNYKPPTLDNIPRRFSVEITTGVAGQNRVLSSKASGEPAVVLAGSVHSAVRHAIEAARKGRYDEHNLGRYNEHYFRLDTPVTMQNVKELCGFDIVEEYLKHREAGIL